LASIYGMFMEDRIGNKYSIYLFGFYVDIELYFEWQTCIPFIVNGDERADLYSIYCQWRWKGRPVFPLLSMEMKGQTCIPFIVNGDERAVIKLITPNWHISRFTFCFVSILNIFLYHKNCFKYCILKNIENYPKVNWEHRQNIYR